MNRRQLLVSLLLPLGLSACTTVKSYEPKAEAGPARAADYPVYVYPEKIGVPRPYEVVGAMSIRDTPITIFGGSLEAELNALRKKARKVGADAVRLTSVAQPDFLHAKYRVEANLIRFRDVWESVPLSESEFQTYLAENRASLDPIEGIWSATDVMQSRVGIMRSEARVGRDFIAFILTNSNPAWHGGDKKMELAAGERPGVYRGYYFLDDYQRQGVAFTLRGDPPNTFFFKLDEDAMPIIFTRQ